jgi:fructose-bisphosphate aldolase class II
MTLATLAEVLQPALLQGYAVPGFVCLGWEDARAFALAGQAERAPVILQAGPGAREHMPVAVWGSMFRALADSVDVPVVAHLDHGQSLDDCRAALDAGFTSLMFDGSRLPLSRNIEETAAVAVVAHSAGVSCEGEIGFVGYSGGATSTGTDPEEAARFCRETGVDALAISIGNLHLQEQAGRGLDLDRLRLIEGVTPVPLVLHGGSGVPVEERARIAATSRICKVNIGTELRMIFGTALRTALSRAPEAYDRISLLRATEAPLQAAAMAILRNLGASGRV